MSFIKYARVERVATFEADSDGRLNKVAKLAEVDHAAQSHQAGTASHYLSDGARALDVRKVLADVSEKYAISADPRDYLFEAIRANTANVPNENHDGFHQSELLRFDHKIGMPVYMTYSSKPHHVNHKTDNPLAARGVILDVHYNDAAGPLAKCASCSHDTSERQHRDATGLHCRKCGYVVRDEFPEILVGVDTKKDPVFARGVQAGQLDSGSMGCNCLNTVCNVCNNVAYSRHEFCAHIRGANKGTLWTKHGSKDDSWRKISALEAEREFNKRGQKFIKDDLCSLWAPDGFEVRKAFEYCQNVIFDEYSRVDQPADPKAKQREILRVAQLHNPKHGQPSSEELTCETQMLIQAAEERRRAAGHDRAASTDGAASRHTKSAEPYYVVRVGDDPMNTHAAPSLDEALEVAGVDAQDPTSVQSAGASYCEVEAMDANSARMLWDDSQAQPVAYGQQEPGESGEPGGPGMENNADVILTPPPGEPVIIQPDEMSRATEPGAPGTDPSVPGAPGEPGFRGPQSIEDFTEDEFMAPAAPGAENELSPAEVGVMPPGAEAPRDPPRRAQAPKSAPRTEAQRRTPMRFRAYKDYKIEVTPTGNAILRDAQRRDVLVVKGGQKVAACGESGLRAFGYEVMRHVAEHGLVATQKKYKGTLSPKFAQVVDGAMDDMKEFSDKYQHNSVLDAADDDMQGSGRSERTPGQVLDEALDDMAEDLRGNMPGSTQDDADFDHDKPQSPPSMATEGGDSDMAGDGDRGSFSLGQSALDNETHDHQEKLAKLTVIGTKVAHKKQPKAVWRVKATKVSLTRAEQKTFGPVSAVVEHGTRGCKGHQLRRVSTRDLLAYWNSLDEARPAGGLPKPKLAGAPQAPKAAPKAASANDRDARTKYEARMRKLMDAKVARAKKEAEADVESAKSAAVESFCRALRIAARRQAAGLEESPIRQAAEAVLSEPRTIGYDAATNQPINYGGLPEEYVRRFTAELFNLGHNDQLESLVKRARELSAAGDQYLADAEADSRAFQPSLPPVTAGLNPSDDFAVRAAQVRAQATGGNLPVMPAPSAEPVGPGHDKRAAIRNAVGNTLTAQLRGELSQMS